MSRPILRQLFRACLLTPWLVVGALLPPVAAHAATLVARVQRIETAVASMQHVRVQLAWPAHAPHGELQLQAAGVVAPAFGYRFSDLDWRCPLRRDGAGGWTCSGPVRSGKEVMQLSVALGSDVLDASLGRGDGRLRLRRDDATPELTRVDLARIPLAWTQALLAQAWSAGRISAGTLSGRLDITAVDDAPLRVAGPLVVDGAGFDTPDGSIAGENLGVHIDVDARIDALSRVRIDGQLRGGELLFGTTYVSLQDRVADLQVEAVQGGAGEGWRLPRVGWHDPGVLSASGSLALGGDASVHALDMRVDSPDLAQLGAGYLSGWLGMAGLSGTTLEGAADAHVQLRAGALEHADLRLHDVQVGDAAGRFGFETLAGDLAFSRDQPVTSELGWLGGHLYSIPFGATRLPFTSGAGLLELTAPARLSMLGGEASIDQLRIRPPAGGEGLDLRFGLTLADLDVARLSEALDWPAFTGQLSGNIPEARYNGDRLEFDGGLSMELFDGAVQVSALSMERPFGVAPTLSADIALNDIDLTRLTGAFEVGGIDGKLDGEIQGLRLLSWQPVAFDARLRSDRHRGVRQRISQRAVQDLSSVGDASFVTSLQSQVIGLFDDFGYSQLGIGCRLADQVCTMDGVGSAGAGFVIVRGSGLPRLDVVGFNRRVDWPTLVERLAAIGSGDVKPVVE